MLEVRDLKVPFIRLRRRIRRESTSGISVKASQGVRGLGTTCSGSATSAGVRFPYLRRDAAKGEAAQRRRFLARKAWGSFGRIHGQHTAVNDEEQQLPSATAGLVGVEVARLVWIAAGRLSPTVKVNHNRHR